MRHKTVMSLAAIMSLAVFASSGCSTPVDRSAAAIESELPTEQESASSPESVPETGTSPQPDAVQGSTAPSLVEPPTPPRSSWVSNGHVVKLQLKPGSGSSIVNFFEAKVAARGQLPDNGRGTELCDATAADSTISDCQLNPLKRGNWDIWVRSVNDAGASDWLQGASVTVDSCTSIDGMAGSCEVFDKGPGGGVIVYDAGSRQEWGRFLEVAPAGWSGSSADPKDVWCPENSASYGERQTAGQSAIGTGAANTALIVGACGTSTAAGRAAGYRGGGLDDWFLPSQEEIAFMYKMRSEVGGLNLGTYWVPSGYWTSSQSDKTYIMDSGNYGGYPDQARALNLTTSPAGGDKSATVEDSKRYTNLVRPMRAF